MLDSRPSGLPAFRPSLPRFGGAEGGRTVTWNAPGLLWSQPGLQPGNECHTTLTTWTFTQRGSRRGMFGHGLFAVCVCAMRWLSYTPEDQRLTDRQGDGETEREREREKEREWVRGSYLTTWLSMTTSGKCSFAVNSLSVICGGGGMTSLFTENRVKPYI